MQIQLTGRHVEISPALREFVDAKMAKLERHAHNMSHVHVILTAEKGRHLAEVTAHVSGSELVAHSDSDNMYAAIDLLMDKMDRQLLKHKSKLQSH